MKFLTGGKQMHDIIGGNTLSGIAQQYGTSQGDLMGMNPQITNPDQIMAGQQMQVGQTPGIMGRIGYGEGQWAPGKLAGGALYNMFQGLGAGGGQQNQKQSFMQRMMKGTEENPGLLTEGGVEALTGHLNQPEEDFTQYISDVQMPTQTWGESSGSKGNNWY